MNRRSVLAASGVALSAIGAGCSLDQEPNENCELIHELNPSRVPGSYDGEPAEIYRYEDLSSEAQQVFDEALVDGVYFTTNQSLRSDEFRYGEIYHVIYHNETYVLQTYVNEGCYGP